MSEEIDASPEEFDHLGHLRFSFEALRRHGAVAGREVIRGALRRFAIRVGRPEKYDDALTCAWIDRVAAAIAEHPGADFDRVLAASPFLRGQD